VLAALPCLLYIHLLPAAVSSQVLHRSLL
jgi:hypothetical protein